MKDIHTHTDRQIVDIVVFSLDQAAARVKHENEVVEGWLVHHLPLHWSTVCSHGNAANANN